MQEATQAQEAKVVPEVTGENAVEALLGLWLRGLGDVRFQKMPDDGASVRRIISFTLDRAFVTEIGREYLKDNGPDPVFGDMLSVSLLTFRKDLGDIGEWMTHAMKARSAQVIGLLQLMTARGYVDIPAEAIGLTEEKRALYAKRPDVEGPVIAPS